jgi:drug/metabolite transporter (DMT)-like permease
MPENEEYKKFGSTDFLMLLTVLFWGVNYSFVKLALADLTPYAFNGLRLFISTLILLLVLWISGEGFSLPREDVLKVVAISLIGNTIYQILFIQGINRTTASNTALILAMSPVFIAVLGSFVLRERIHWAGWMGIFISFIGLYFVISKQAGYFNFSSQTLRGDLMILFANICWAVFTVFSKPFLGKISPLKFTTLTLAIGTLFFLPFSVKDIGEIQWQRISFKAWASFSYSTLFAIVICFIIWYASVKRVGSSKTGIYGNLTPVVAVSFASIFLGEKISIFQVWGALIILFGVYLTRSGYRWFERKKGLTKKFVT